MEGMSRRPGGAGQFILESGIVLTAFGPTFVPVPGYLPGIGVDEDNSADPPDYADDFYEGETEPLFGWGGAPSTVRTRITTPEEYTANGVGQLVSSEVADGRRRVVWETDHPVSLFNVVAGRYDVIEGDGTAIYYHPKHDYNIEEMSAALDAARRYYSEWFYPFPWDLLKISEFPAYATYAQGFSDEYHLQRGDRVPRQERPNVARRLHGRRARGRAPMVGEPARARRGPRRQRSFRGDGTLLDHAASRTGIRRPLPHGVRQADRVLLRRRPLRRLRSARSCGRTAPARATARSRTTRAAG